MAAISRRWRGGRIYNNTRTRERLRRKCVKPAALTTHFPSKICSRPRTATRPARAFSHSLPAHFRPPTQPKRTPAGCAMHSSPPSQHISRRRSAPAPAQRRALPLPSCHIPAAQTHARRPHHPFPTEDLRPPPHSDAPCPCPPATSHAAPMHTRRPHNPFPAKSLRPSPHSDTPVPAAPPCLPFCSTSGTKKRHRTVDVRCRMSRSTVVAVGHWGW